MQFAPIVPVQYDPASFTTYHLILAHQVLQDKVYRDYYMSLSYNHTIIIDNSTVELGTPVDVLRAAEYFIGSKAKIIIVAPDVLSSKRDTVELFREFFPKWLEYEETDLLTSKLSLMVVPQGKDRIEWLQCLKALSKLGRFGYVGIPRIAEDFEGGRQGLRYAVNTHLFKEKYENDWKFHLLGIQHKIQEVEWALDLTNSILGVDSSLPLRAALQGDDPTSIEDLRTVPDIDKFDNTYYTTVQTSIQKCVDYCSGKWRIGRP